MSGKSYKACLDDLLIPLGFTREGRDWSRVRDGLEETVNLQISNIAGSTINLMVVDLESARLWREALGELASPFPSRIQRIGHLIDGYDHWWRRDPDGPAQLTEAVRVYGLPFFDQVRTLEDQAGRWFGRNSRSKWHERSMVALAITLFRMGEIEEARAALSLPPPRIVPSNSVARVERVRAWLESQVARRPSA